MLSNSPKLLIVRNFIMMIFWKKFILILSTLFISCVQNKIFIHVAPDGKSFFKFESLGDSIDICDNDFVHPYHLKSWVTEIWKVKTDNKTNWRRITKGLVNDSIIIMDVPGPNEMKYEFHQFNISNWYKETYDVKIIIQGRKIKQDYPKLYNAILTDKMDSLEWLPEALTVLMHKGLNDISHDSISPEQSLWNRRLVNHLKNSFAKHSSYNDLKKIYRDRTGFLNNILSPFNISPALLDELSYYMEIHENFLRASLNLKDDSFTWKFLLPGQVLNTNATRLLGDTLVWEFGLDSLLSQKYTLYGSSVIYAEDKINIFLISKLIIGVILLITIWFFTKNIF